MVYLTRRETFNAAHKLSRPDWTDERNAEVFGKCANKNWHGHNYVLHVTVAGQPHPETGFVMDAKVLRDIIRQYVTDVVDHANLNMDVEWMDKTVQPTTENLCIAFWGQLVGPIEATGVKLHKIKLAETENIHAEYYGPAGE